MRAQGLGVWARRARNTKKPLWRWRRSSRRTGNQVGQIRSKGFMCGLVSLAGVYSRAARSIQAFLQVYTHRLALYCTSLGRRTIHIFFGLAPVTLSVSRKLHGKGRRKIRCATDGAGTLVRSRGLGHRRPYPQSPSRGPVSIFCPNRSTFSTAARLTLGSLGEEELEAVGRSMGAFNSCLSGSL